MAKSERDLIGQVFKLLDVDGDNRLSPAELKVYAVSQGFQGPQEEFDEEWRNLVSDYGWDATRGPDESQFITAVQDEEGSCFAERPELEIVIQALQAKTGGATTPERAELQKQLFVCLDRNKDGVVEPLELLNLARLMEYGDTEEAWLQEYGTLCANYGANEDEGIDEACFFKIIGDESGDMNIETELMQEMLEELGKPAEPSRLQPSGATQSTTRTAIVRDLFDVLDLNKDGLLSATEMFTFAGIMEYPGTDEEWSEEYDKLCQDYGCSPQVGLTQEKFAALLNDDQGDMFCEDDQIQEMVEEILQKEKKPALGKGPRPSEAQQRNIEMGPQRQDYINVLFDALDLDNLQNIEEKELLPFFKHHPNIAHTGIEGSMAYRTICGQQGCEPEKGLTRAAFAEMLDNKACDAFCDDSNLRRILSEMAPKSLRQLDSEVVGEGTKLICIEATDIYQSAEDTDVVMGEVQPDEEVVCSGVKIIVMGDVALVPIRRLDVQRPEGVVELKNFCKSEGQSREAALPSRERIEAAFDRLDINGDGGIGERELWRLCSMLDTMGEEDFYSEYKLLCLRYGILSDSGCTKEQFVKLVMDEKSPLWCTSALLEEAISKMPRVEDSTKLAKRTPLMAQVFDACDVDGDKMLSEVELLRFAKSVGFPGDDSDWNIEYKGLCEDAKVSPTDGIPFKAFRTMVDDSEGDYTCTDQQLASMLAAIQWDLKNEESRQIQTKEGSGKSRPAERESQYGRPRRESRLMTKEEKAATSIQSGFRMNAAQDRVRAMKSGATYETCGCGKAFIEGDKVCRGCKAKRPRKEITVHCPARSQLLSQIFRGLDLDKDQRLSKGELLAFARHCEFSGTAEAWDNEFEALCADYDWDPKRGIGVKAFTTFVNDPAGLCFCTDEELGALHRELAVMQGHGPMIDHMHALLPNMVDEEDCKYAKLAFHSASLKGVAAKLEDPLIPQSRDITVLSVSDPLKKLAAKHKDVEALSASQVGEEMNDVTQYLRTHTIQHDRSALAALGEQDHSHHHAHDDDNSSYSSEESDVYDEEAEFVKTCVCGYGFSDGQRFCRRCGIERGLAELCLKCGEAVEPTDTKCNKCGEGIERVTDKRDKCGDCGTVYADESVRFCSKCKAPRPVSDSQCVCGAQLVEGQPKCMQCGMSTQYDEEEVANEALREELEAQKNLSKEEKKKYKQEQVDKKLAEQRQHLEKHKAAVSESDNQRQLKFDQAKKEAMAVRQETMRKTISSGEKLPPGSLMRTIVEADETSALSVLSSDVFISEAHTRDARGCTALHCAAERGLTNICRALLTSPSYRDAAVRDKEGWSALHRAAKNGHSVAVKCLASHPALTGPNLARGRDGFTALHCAAIHGFTATVRVLLDHPRFQDINLVDQWGRTALYCASEYGHQETVKAFLEHSRFTNHSAKTKWGTTDREVAKGEAKDAYVNHQNRTETDIADIDPDTGRRQSLRGSVAGLARSVRQSLSGGENFDFSTSWQQKAENWKDNYKNRF